MTIKVRSLPGEQVDQLETKLNEILSKPESAGYLLVTVCPITTSTGQVLLLVFQKP
jgi:hypothetical protein